MHALPAAAQDAPDEILMSRADAALCAAALTEAPLLRSKIVTLEADVALKDRALDAYARLHALDEAIIGKEQRLRQLAEAERDVFKEKAERAGQGDRWLRCRANAGAVGVLGFGIGTVVPGVGNIAGAALGGLAGCIGGFLGLLP